MLYKLFYWAIDDDFSYSNTALATEPNELLSLQRLQSSVFPNLIAEDGNITLSFTGVSTPSMLSWQEDFKKAPDKSWLMTPDVGVVVAFWLKWLRVLNSKELLMEPGTLDTIFSSLCKGSLAQPESFLAHGRHCHPPAPPGLFPGWCTKAIQTHFFRTAFSSSWVLVAVSTKGNTPLSAPVWLFLLCTSEMWF